MNFFLFDVKQGNAKLGHLFLFKKESGRLFFTFAWVTVHLNTPVLRHQCTVQKLP